jgi:hypothetical protein
LRPRQSADTEKRCSERRVAAVEAEGEESEAETPPRVDRRNGVRGCHTLLMALEALELERPGGVAVASVIAVLGDSLEQDLRQISPELILVSPPDIAERARALLPEIVLSDQAPGARVSVLERSSALGSDRPREPSALADYPVTPASTPRTGMLRALVVVVGVLTVVAVVVGTFFVVGGNDRKGRPTAASALPDVVSQSTRHTGQIAAQPADHAANASEPAQAVSTESPGRPSPAVKPVLHASLGSVDAAPVASSAPPVATSVNPPSKSTSTTFVPSRVFAWPAVPGATFYLVRFYRDGREVFQGQVTTTTFTVPSTLRFIAGSYRWNVVAAFGSTAEPRYGTRIVDSTFTVSPVAYATGP